MVDAGCAYCFMEVSLARASCSTASAGLAFEGRHLHQHHPRPPRLPQDLRRLYPRPRSSFSTGLPAGAFALTNADDRNGTRDGAEYPSDAWPDLRAPVGRRLHGAAYVETAASTACCCVWTASEVWVEFLGRFNAYNLTERFMRRLCFWAPGRGRSADVSLS